MNNNIIDKVDYKQPKGTCDYYGIDQRNRERLVNACITTFILYNAEPMDTPSFELTDAITKGVSTDTAKETFELIPEHTESERYTLRYDQTMPFARFAKQQKITKLRRYQIGYVYRRDQPNMSTCRFRQFLQVDYDNLGNSQDIPSTDAETLIMLCDILNRMKLDSAYLIKINTIGLLKNVLTYCNISTDKFQSVCRCLDKIQKHGWQKVKQELHDLNISDESANKLKGIIDTFDSPKNYYNAEGFQSFDKFVVDGIMEQSTKTYLDNLYNHLTTIMNNSFVRKTIVLDLSLARGLDYYTGLLFEVEMCSKLGKKIGSVAGGGRYDGLCGNDTECIGFSLGIDRLLKFVIPITKRAYAPKTWVIQVSDGNDVDYRNDESLMSKVYEYKLWIVQRLRNAGISTGTEMRIDVGVGPQMRYVLKKEIPFVLFIGVNEFKNRTVSFKDVSTQEQIELDIDLAIAKINNIK